MRVLVLGGGLIRDLWIEKLQTSSIAVDVFYWPRPAGNEKSAQILPADDDASVVSIAKAAKRCCVDLVIVLNKDLLEQGINNALQVFRIPCFGTTRDTAQLIKDKLFIKNMLEKYQIPTPKLVSESPVGSSLSFNTFVGRARHVDMDPKANQDAGIKYLKSAILDAFEREGLEFVGCLQVSLTWTADGPAVVDVTCQMNNPNEIAATFNSSGDWLSILCGLLNLRPQAGRFIGAKNMVLNKSIGFAA